MLRATLATLFTTVTGLAFAQSTPLEPLPAPRTPADRYKAIVKACQQAQEDFSKAYQAAKTDEERKEVSDRFGRRSMFEYHAGVLLDLMGDHPKDPAALESARWIISRIPDSDEASRAADAVLRDWIEEPRLNDFFELMYHSSPVGDRLLRAAIAKNPDRAVQGFARLKLAVSLKRRADRMTDRRPADREPSEREADELLQQVIDKYADVKHLTTLGKEAEQLRFEIRHLKVGGTPPDVEGADLDGKPLKLSDYRGKVTLVVFWAGWCGPCMAAVPHEKELLKKYEGRPFAVVGINADKNLAEGKAVAEKAGVSWRSFADCKRGGGPIATRWNVDAWPTQYLLDGTGTIRFKGDYLRSQSVRTGKDGKPEQYYFLDDAVEQLVTEAERKP